MRKGVFGAYQNNKEEDMHSLISSFVVGAKIYTIEELDHEKLSYIVEQHQYRSACAFVQSDHCAIV